MLMMRRRRIKRMATWTLPVIKIKIMMMMMRGVAARAWEDEENKNQEDGEVVACDKMMIMMRRPNLELAWRKLSTARVTREPRIVKPTCTISSSVVVMIIKMVMTMTMMVVVMSMMMIVKTMMVMIFDI